ncbi:MAG TPA: hypothetical protein VFN10_22555 [Thermoanaerobaculia bacterium]|nr:hypothetical protein [Thermoanaerobaculia bacterium]
MLALRNINQEIEDELRGSNSTTEASAVSFNWNPNITEIIITAVLSLVTWTVKRVNARLDEHSKRIADIELSLARDYVKHDHLADLKREQRRIGRMLGYIQLQLVAMAARLNVRVEPFITEAEEESNVAA